MRDGYHNGRQSWWWRNDDDPQDLEMSDAGDDERPATPPPDIRSTLPGLIRKPRDGKPTYPGRREESVGDKALHVLVVEWDIEARNRLVVALLDQGCHVHAFRTVKRAEVHAIYWGYDVLIASPEILEQTAHWTAMIPGEPPLASLAITVNRDADARIRAQRAGARSVLLAPFDGQQIDDHLQQILSQLRRELKLAN